VKAAVHVPVIASLNGTTAGGWLEYARLMEQAGADAIEAERLSRRHQARRHGRRDERQTIDVVHAVKHAVRIPIAVKLSPSYTAPGHVAAQIDRAGADGLVLFNRFYQPDLDIEELAVSPTLHLSSSAELLPRLHWTAILSGRIQCSLAVTGGVHTAEDIIKATMAGAHGTQVVSAAADERAAVPPHADRELDGVDGEARMGVTVGDARQSQFPQGARPRGLRARELHAHAAELERRGHALRVTRRDVVAACR
jgi:dihydroorotate dehydrogenase (fumarate)